MCDDIMSNYPIVHMRIAFQTPNFPYVYVAIKTQTIDLTS